MYLPIYNKAYKNDKDYFPQRNLAYGRCFLVLNKCFACMLNTKKTFSIGSNFPNYSVQLKSLAIMTFCDNALERRKFLRYKKNYSLISTPHKLMHCINCVTESLVV